MFKGCKSMRKLELSTFVTNNVTEMGEMFSDCSNLDVLKLNNFDTVNAINMNRKFIIALL